ncbi:T9SS type B sorting domain-containing protein [Flavobacterium silvaticum]|uniref:T9SS type B sorting domain-containing protein n=1 Tax=Flavobacterium silvaticum TaxID=1852020 RepID=A0A972FRB5_9FLAO|nr:T9SS type B sorting domain-containing protein [Flavobacterium silvaticum]NMH27068.1 T9SS type B sorting domain-containing protein [Flavobacterium silvaticum]
MPEFYLHAISRKFKWNLLILLLISSLVSFSQNETNHWYFGENAGLDFSNGEFALDFNGAMNTPAGCSSISDKDGILMLYTNGATVWNRNHEIMENGSDLFTDIDSVQTCAIVPNPINENLYYIFHSRQTASVDPFVQKGLYYSIVDFSTNPLGQVTLKNVRLRDNMTAHIATTFDYATNTFKVFTIGAAGGSSSVNNTVFIWTVGQDGIPEEPNPQMITLDYDFSSTGQMKISPNHSMLAIASGSESKVYVFDLNLSAPSITFKKYFVTIVGLARLIPYGVEFSQDSYWLYSSTSGSLFRFEPNPPPYPYEPEVEMVGAGNGSLQLARNGKIYCANLGADPRLKRISVVNSPEKPIDSVDFRWIDISESNSTLGLPNIPAALLRSRIIANEKCFGESIAFSVDSFRPVNTILWDFGDGSTSTELTPEHLFATPGLHKVTATIPGRNDYPVTLYKDVFSYHFPSIPANTYLRQCDADNNGSELFNLNNLNGKLPQYEGIRYEYTFSFYHTPEDLMADTNPIQNPDHYVNTINPEKIFVKMVNQFGCTTLTDFMIQAEYHPLPPLDPYVVCEGTDGIEDNYIGRFWLGMYEESIRDQLNISDVENLQFYPSQQDALGKTNEIIVDDDMFKVDFPSTTLWLRIDDESNDCTGIGPYELIVNPPVVTTVPGQVILCGNESIILSGNPENTAWEWKKITGTAAIIGTEREITITEPGGYQITEFHTANGKTCKVVKNFAILAGGAITFDVVEAGSNSIYVSVTGNSDYEFSIDNLNFYGSGTEYTFSNVQPGIYTVYVRDKADCEVPINTQVVLISFDPYFTPNGDGYNDLWKVRNVDGYFSKIKIDIFNRFGALLYSMENNEGWNGILNGKELPSSDYWFKAELTDLQNITATTKGHFSLVR